MKLIRFCLVFFVLFTVKSMNAQYEMSEKQIEVGFDFLKQNGNFRNPSSVKLYDHRNSTFSFTNPCFTWVNYEVIAQNGFGADTRASFKIYFHDGLPIYCVSDESSYYMFCNSDKVAEKVINLAKLQGVEVKKCGKEQNIRNESINNNESYYQGIAISAVFDIQKALEEKDFVQAYSLTSKAGDLLDSVLMEKIMIGWLPIKNEIDSAYNIYLDKYDRNSNNILSEYQDNVVKFINTNKTKISETPFIWYGDNSYKKLTNALVKRSKTDEYEVKNNGVYLFNNDKEFNIIPLSVNCKEELNDILSNNNNVDVSFNLKSDIPELGLYPVLTIETKSSKSNYYIKNYVSIPSYLYSLELDKEVVKLIEKHSNSKESNIHFLNTMYKEKKVILGNKRIIHTSTDSIEVVLKPKKDFVNDEFAKTETEFNQKIEKPLNGYLKNKDEYLNPKINPSYLMLARYLHPEIDTFVFYTHKTSNLGEEIWLRSVPIAHAKIDSQTEYVAAILPIKKNFTQFEQGYVTVYNDNNEYSNIVIEPNVFSQFTINETLLNSNMKYWSEELKSEYKQLNVLYDYFTFNSEVAIAKEPTQIPKNSFNYNIEGYLSLSNGKIINLVEYRYPIIKDTDFHTTMNLHKRQKDYEVDAKYQILIKKYNELANKYLLETNSSKKDSLLLKVNSVGLQIKAYFLKSGFIF